MNFPKLCLHLFRFFGWPRRKAGRQKNWSTDSFNCSPPRKSLVKGERFMRDEGKPEQFPTLLIQRYVEDDSLTQVGFAFIIYAPAH